jgi:CYTH domain-containing protein
VQPPEGPYAGKYARWELERRFLVDRVPAEIGGERGWRITDRYLDGALLRLRRMEPLAGGEAAYKLTKKEAPKPPDTSRTIITTIYLSPEDYAALVDLPARTLTKRRRRIDVDGRVFSVDVFEGHLSGLVLAEVSFDTEEDLDRQRQLPCWVGREVTKDERFTGGALARLSRDEAGELIRAVAWESVRPAQ